MRGTYRCTNVKFCMEDENQRRAWEYLHGLNRRDGSYGKVLADALIAVIDSRSNSQNAMRKRRIRMPISGVMKHRLFSLAALKIC